MFAFATTHWLLTINLLVIASGGVLFFTILLRTINQDKKANMASRLYAEQQMTFPYFQAFFAEKEREHKESWIDGLIMVSISFLVLFIFPTLILLTILNTAIVVAYALVTHADLLVRTIDNPLFVWVWFLLSIIFFRLRGAQPLMYGLGEVFVGTTAIFYAVQSSEYGLLAKILSLSGGIYIIVRGLDNIEKGLPVRYREVWFRWFPKKSVN